MKNLFKSSAKLLLIAGIVMYSLASYGQTSTGTPENNWIVNSDNSSTSAVTLQLRDNTAANNVEFRNNDGKLDLRVGTNTNMTITNTGNVGIGLGNASPSEKLHVAGGSLYFNGEGQGVIIDAAGFKRIGLMKYSGREAGIWRVANQDFEIGRVSSTNDIKNGAGAVVDMHFLGNGNVVVNSKLLVGTSNAIAGTIAHFDGRVYISEEGGSEAGFDSGFASRENYQDFLLWVEEGIVSNDYALSIVNEWPDYVFEEAYDLSSIAQVEDFIKENGHLHTMPSAEEIESNGFTVSDMTKRMVKTIEEMTLHTIDQEKKITELTDRLAKLEAYISNQ